MCVGNVVFNGVCTETLLCNKYWCEYSKVGTCITDRQTDRWALKRLIIKVAGLGCLMPHAALVIILQVFFPLWELVWLRNTWRALCCLAALLFVCDYDYLPSWLDLLWASWVFSATACGLIETNETLQLFMFFWSSSDWQIWLCGRKHIFEFPPWLQRFNTDKRSSLGWCFALNNDFVSGGAHVIKKTNILWPRHIQYLNTHISLYRTLDMMEVRFKLCCVFVLF